jgi:hypothetical protein
MTFQVVRTCTNISLVASCRKPCDATGAAVMLADDELLAEDAAPSGAPAADPGANAAGSGAAPAAHRGADAAAAASAPAASSAASRRAAGETDAAAAAGGARRGTSGAAAGPALATPEPDDDAHMCGRRVLC